MEKFTGKGKSPKLRKLLEGGSGGSWGPSKIITIRKKSSDFPKIMSKMKVKVSGVHPLIKKSEVRSIVLKAKKIPKNPGYQATKSSKKVMDRFVAFKEKPVSTTRKFDTISEQNKVIKEIRTNVQKRQLNRTLKGLKKNPDYKTSGVKPWKIKAHNLAYKQRLGKALKEGRYKNEPELKAFAKKASKIKPNDLFLKPSEQSPGYSPAGKRFISTGKDYKMGMFKDPKGSEFGRDVKSYVGKRNRQITISKENASRGRKYGLSIEPKPPLLLIKLFEYLSPPFLPLIAML